VSGKITLIKVNEEAPGQSKLRQMSCCSGGSFISLKQERSKVPETLESAFPCDLSLESAF